MINQPRWWPALLIITSRILYTCHIHTAWYTRSLTVNGHPWQLEQTGQSKLDFPQPDSTFTTSGMHFKLKHVQPSVTDVHLCPFDQLISPHMNIQYQSYKTFELGLSWSVITACQLLEPVVRRGWGWPKQPGIGQGTRLTATGQSLSRTAWILRWKRDEGQWHMESQASTHETDQSEYRHTVRTWFKYQTHQVSVATLQPGWCHSPLSHSFDASWANTFNSTGSELSTCTCTDVHTCHELRTVHTAQHATTPVAVHTEIQGSICYGIGNIVCVILASIYKAYSSIRMAPL